MALYQTGRRLSHARALHRRLCQRGHGAGRRDPRPRAGAGLGADGDDGVRVFTDRDTYEADSLVFTAGSWNSELMPWLHGLAVPERQVLIWMQPQRPNIFSRATFPVFNCLVAEGRFYGFPVYGVPGFKFGKYHHFRGDRRPESLIERQGEPRPTTRRCCASLPRATSPRHRADDDAQVCMFTNAPDGHFIVDLHPEYPQVSFASAVHRARLQVRQRDRRNHGRDRRPRLFALGHFVVQSGSVRRAGVEFVQGQGAGAASGDRRA